MSNVNSLLPQGDHANQRARAVALAKKWEKTGLLEDLKVRDKMMMAVMLENQAKQLVTEANSTGTSANSEEWSGIALPLVRRIFAEISAKEFVSVQPMNLPSGLVFWLEFKYSTGQPGFNTGAGKDSQNDSLMGVTDANRGTAASYGDATPTEGLYGAGRFGYTINDYSSSALVGGSSANSTTWTTGSLASADYNHDSAFSQSLLVGGSRIHKVIIHKDAISGFDPHGVRAFTLSNASGTLVHDVYQAFTKYNSTTGLISFVVSGSAAATGSQTITVNYHKQPTDVTRGDFEEGKTQAGSAREQLDIPEIDLQMRSEPIVAKTRKLKAVWTPEFAQDINAYQNIDAEAELTGILSEYISMEIDLEILDMIISEAPTVDYWSTRIGYQHNGSAFELSAANVTAYNQGTWFQTIGTKLQKLSNKIHQLTLRGGANFIVTSPTIATILESIPGFAADTDGTQAKFAMGVQKIGGIKNQWDVYKNPYMLENLILVGFRGSNYLETGAVYSPYIPLMMTPLLYDPDNFTPRKGVMTRYGKKVTRPEFYAKLYVEGLHLI